MFYQSNWYNRWMSSASIPAEFTLNRKYTANRNTPARWIISHALRYWPLILLILIGAMGNAGLAAVVPIMVGDAFNQMLRPNPDVSFLLPLALILGGSQIVRGLLQFGRNFGAELIAQKIERNIRDELYISLLGKSMTFHNLQPVGDTMARATNDVREVNYMFSPGFNLVIGSAMFLMMPFIFIFLPDFFPEYYAGQKLFHPAMILAPAFFAISYIIALWHYLWKLSPITDDVRNSFGTMNTHLSEALDGVETMKAAAQEDAEINRFAANAQRVRAAFVRQGDLEARFLPNLLLGITYAIGLVHALLLIRDGLIDLGGVVAYFGLLRMLEFPTFVSTFAYTHISLGLSSARRILELINRETNLDQNTAGFSSVLRGDIEFRNLSFEYNKGEPVLENISFKVKAGQVVALVGQTGSGKTSLVKLINRTYDASDGQVLVDGVDVREWNLASLRSQISMIEQDIFLFSRSISDNISFGNPEAGLQEVEASAKSAQADEFIRSFDEGFNTVIGERGVTLSGGERQRLALARAFLTNPHVLILDDSTSAIDSATEDKIQRAIANAARGRTTFLITHRLSQIRWADIIIVLRKGRIAAIGSHVELLKTSPSYSNIFRE
ncbi:MAG: ABC transporter ATP-binding protein [Anaerolineae bacterium]|nr:ABC transporter ATP-binding protein [Anaerolineae bacterium]